MSRKNYHVPNRPQTLQPRRCGRDDHDGRLWVALPLRRKALRDVRARAADLNQPLPDVLESVFLLGLSVIRSRRASR